MRALFLIAVVVTVFFITDAGAQNYTERGDYKIMARDGGNAYYICEMDVTLPANFNPCATNGIGQWNYEKAKQCIVALNDMEYLGFNGWRLPQHNEGGDSAELPQIYSHVFGIPAGENAADYSVFPFYNLRSPYDYDEPFDGYWSSHVVPSPYVPGVFLAYQFHFNYGIYHRDGLGQPDAVLPVADGDPLWRDGDEECNTGVCHP